MTSPSFRDIEALSAYIDGQISARERTRLEIRLQSDQALTSALNELRQTRAILKRLPRRRAARNFTLTPGMAGIRPPVPRLVPVFSWASAAAILLFIVTLGTSLIGQLSIGPAAPMLAAAPSGLGGGPAAATTAPANSAPATAAPATAAPVTAPQGTADQTGLATPTIEAFVMSVPEPVTPPATPGTLRTTQPPSAPKALPKPLVSPWLVIWAGLGFLLGALALVLHWLNRLAFRRKNPPE
jgi:anti-sigma factor RsiW